MKIMLQFCETAFNKKKCCSLEFARPFSNQICMPIPNRHLTSDYTPLRSPNLTTFTTTASCNWEKYPCHNQHQLLFTHFTMNATHGTHPSPHNGCHVAMITRYKRHIATISHYECHKSALLHNRRNCPMVTKSAPKHQRTRGGCGSRCFKAQHEA